MSEPTNARTLSASDLNTSIAKDEPRIRDERLGECLGMARPRDIRKLIERNTAELEGFGPLRHRGAMVEIGSRATREVKEYWLNEEQALLICMFARTSRAQAVRREVITVFTAWRQRRMPMILPAASRNWHPTRAEQREINSRASALLQAHFHPVRDMIIAQMKQDRAKGIVKQARDYGIRHLPAANDRKPFDHAIFVIDGQYITADCTATTYWPGDQVIAINTEDGSGPDIFTIAETAIPKSWFDRCHLANPRTARDHVRPVVVVIGIIVKEGCNEKTRMDGDHRSDHRGIDHDGM
ncbi:hypothetical protein [Thalassospira xiamenensis]|uniref:Uncharacterized protein n=1 Tax=Thalassospira xiamenensis TaxID=220697 RepID=A0ABR5XWT8_9PROT|nr:hypothetical protein [Thalassospira xiamenensis]KZC97216.1 hypothetical protein AUP40_04565 [Thalassospira xiamenensis]KZD10191.1 hypothetical protein AUP45_02645 [Thalassospira xiamenensis]MCD1593161.1 hypothetical protein [Thalassospira xiamenensis]